MNDWRIENYDEMIDRAEWIRDHPGSYEILAYYRSWVANTAQRIRLFPGGDLFAREFEGHIEHRVQILNLERGSTETLPIVMDVWVQYLKKTRRKLIDLLTSLRSSAGSSTGDDLGYHLFLSYASEDKEFVDDLLHKLPWLNLKVWYDDTELKVGDSIRRSIDRGIVHSRYGVVILSPSYLAKKWTQYELDGLLAREGIDYKVLLPVWYNLKTRDLLKVSPTLAQRLALDAGKLPIDAIAFRIAEVVASE